MCGGVCGVYVWCVWGVCVVCVWGVCVPRCAALHPTPTPTNQPANQPTNQPTNPTNALFLGRGTARCGAHAQVYASKTDAAGVPLTGAVISSLFVTGFASSLVFGTVITSLSDTTGRKKAVLMCAGLFVCSCASVHADSMPLLYAGRLAGGVASSLMHAAFEAWLCTLRCPA